MRPTVWSMKISSSRMFRSMACAVSTELHRIELSTPFDANAKYGLNTAVALRPEPFGALMYHFRTRRLAFLKDPALVAVVQRLADKGSVLEALAECDLSPSRHASYLRALASLAEADVIVRI